MLENLKLKPFLTEGLFFLGEFYLDNGEKEKAMGTLKEAETMFEGMRMDYWLARAKVVMERL